MVVFPGYSGGFAMGRFVENRIVGKTFAAASLDDYVADDNPVRVVEAFIDELDLVAVGFAGTAPAQTGRPAYRLRRCSRSTSAI
jgi:transposase